MLSYEEAAKTFRDIECELESLDTCYEIPELDKIETRTVRMLQLLEAQIGSIGAELYSNIKMRRAAISQGKFAPVEKQEAEKPVKKTTKRSKKAKQ